MTEQIENSINAIGMVTTIINTLTNVGDTIQKYSQQNIRELLISLMYVPTNDFVILIHSHRGCFYSKLTFVRDENVMSIISVVEDNVINLFHC